MANKFEALRGKMSPAARDRAERRAQTMLAEIAPPGLDSYRDGQIRELNEGGSDLAEDLSRRSRSKK
jgi:hypothetical protein